MWLICNCTLTVLIHRALWRTHATVQRSHAHPLHLAIVHIISHPLLMHSLHWLNRGKRLVIHTKGILGWQHQKDFCKQVLLHLHVLVLFFFYVFAFTRQLLIYSNIIKCQKQSSTLCIGCMSCGYSPAPWPCMACGTLGGPGLGPIMLCTEPGEGPGPGLGPRMGPGDRPAPGEGPAWDIPTGGSLGVDIDQLRIWVETKKNLNQL